MLRAQEPLQPGLVLYGLHEFRRNVALQQAIAVLRDRRVISSRIVYADADEDRPQRVVPAHPRLQIDVAEERARPLLAASHSSLASASPHASESQRRPNGERLFQQPAWWQRTEVSPDDIAGCDQRP
jgi:hypothetical protein